MEVARLRALQEQVQDTRSAEDELRAKRYQVSTVPLLLVRLSSVSWFEQGFSRGVQDLCLCQVSCTVCMACNDCVRHCVQPN
jgi:hypothetical protein